MSKFTKEVLKGFLVLSIILVMFMIGIKVGIEITEPKIREKDITIENLQDEVNAKDKQIIMYINKLSDIGHKYNKALGIDNPSLEQQAQLYGISEQELFEQGRSKHYEGDINYNLKE